jgi:hypothetical protein
MARKQGNNGSAGNPLADALAPATPRSLSIATEGVKTGRDFARLMSAVMSDLIEGKITPAVGNAACNAGGKLLKAVEMQMKYGTKTDGGEPVLRLTGESI